MFISVIPFDEHCKAYGFGQTPHTCGGAVEILRTPMYYCPQMCTIGRSCTFSIQYEKCNYDRFRFPTGMNVGSPSLEEKKEKDIIPLIISKHSNTGVNTANCSECNKYCRYTASKFSI
jgi:hypothetical protein